MINDSNRWPIIVVSVLIVTVAVNVVFGWVAIRDESGGFELVSGEISDASYKLKMPLDK